MADAPLNQPPGWVSDYTEGLDHITHERDMFDIESRFPGLNHTFDKLIDSLPDPNKGSTEFPISAAVIERTKSGIEVVSFATNRTNTSGDSTKHAEMIALQEAMAKWGSKHLDGLGIVSTCEPCVMCTGAILNCEVPDVIYATPQRSMLGKHALIGESFKPWRVSGESFNAKEYLEPFGMSVIEGYRSKDVANKLKRTPVNWLEYYNDPDL